MADPLSQWFKNMNDNLLWEKQQAENQRIYERDKAFESNLEAESRAAWEQNVPDILARNPQVTRQLGGGQQLDDRQLYNRRGIRNKAVQTGLASNYDTRQFTSDFANTSNFKPEFQKNKYYETPEGTRVYNPVRDSSSLLPGGPKPFAPQARNYQSPQEEADAAVLKKRQMDEYEQQVNVTNNYQDNVISSYERIDDLRQSGRDLLEIGKDAVWQAPGAGLITDIVTLAGEMTGNEGLRASAAAQKNLQRYGAQMRLAAAKMMKGEGPLTEAERELGALTQLTETWTPEAILKADALMQRAEKELDIRAQSFVGMPDNQNSKLSASMEIRNAYKAKKNNLDQIEKAKKNEAQSLEMRKQAIANEQGIPKSWLEVDDDGRIYAKKSYMDSRKKAIPRR